MRPFDLRGLGGAAIHVDDDAAIPVRFGAEELQRYLHRLSGVVVPIQRHAAGPGRAALALAPATAAFATPEPAAPSAAAFTIVPERDRVTLTGGSARALLAAVYALLGQLGCRWSLPGAPEETIRRWGDAGPELAALQHAPRFERSGYCSDIMTWHYTQPEHLHDRLPDDRIFIDWMGKSGASSFFYIRHPFDTQLTIPELTTDLACRGIEVEYGGHVIPLLLPRELYATHPEYFPQAPDGQRTEYGNLCASNADALAIAARHATQYAREYPEMHALHIWGADLWQGGWCRCGACAPLTAQDQSLLVCNAVARGMAEAGQARPVCYLAYHDTIAAQLQVRPEAAVGCEFAPRERCYGHALDDPECATNRHYAEALERYVEWFEGRVRLFEYYGDAILFCGCAVPLTEVIAADMAYYHRLGIREILMLQFGSYSTFAYPLNFLAFAAAAGAPVAAGRAGDDTLTTARAQYCARFGAPAAAAAALRDLERIMRAVVTYGDIRRLPPAAAERERLLRQVEAALPSLAAVAERLAAVSDEGLQAQAALVRYTQAVLEGVQHELRAHGSAETVYAAALHWIEALDRRFKGVWGSVDLPIIHSFYAAAALHEHAAR